LLAAVNRFKYRLYARSQPPCAALSHTTQDIVDKQPRAPQAEQRLLEVAGGALSTGRSQENGEQLPGGVLSATTFDALLNCARAKLSRLCSVISIDAAHSFTPDCPIPLYAGCVHSSAEAAVSACKLAKFEDAAEKCARAVSQPRDPPLKPAMQATGPTAVYEATCPCRRFSTGAAHHLCPTHPTLSRVPTPAPRSNGLPTQSARYKMIANPEDGSLTVTVYGKDVRLRHSYADELHRTTIDHPR
jgi:hypothetical protein